MDEKNQQEILFKLSMSEQQIQQMHQQLQAVEQGSNELQSLNLGLEELNGKKGKEIFAPIGRGIFAKAQLLSEDLTVDIGNKNFVKKTIPQAQELIKDQIEKLEEVKVELNTNLEKITRETRELIEGMDKKE